MGARVLYRDSQGQDGHVELAPDAPVYVGRALDCAIRTDDAMVSRKHSMIRMEAGRFLVEDLGSANGTHVNEVPVTRQVLSHNDVVRCGSMWLRYIEDAPVAQPQPGHGEPHQAPPQQAAAPKRGGTARLDVGPGGPAGAVQAAPADPQPAPVPPVQAGPGAPAQPQPAAAAPAEPAPAQQAVAHGPPPMPDDGVVGGQVSASERPSLGSIDPSEASVVVDAGRQEEVAKLERELRGLRDQLDELQASYDREAADGRRLRAEAATLRERIAELQRSIEDRDEMVAAQGRVAEELREELDQTREELGRARGELGEIGDSVQARERQLERAQEDIARLKGEIEDQGRKVSELQKIKDDGWRKLNEQLAEIEHLREVIGEQERLLEERRVGQVSQEQTLVELRQRNEGLARDLARLKAERDELHAGEGRQKAQIAALDDENKRLTRLLSEASGGDGSSAAGAIDIAEDLKDLRIEHRKLESDKERLQQTMERAQAEVGRLEDRVAELEVELRDAEERRAAADSAQKMAEDARAKAEVSRHKAEEEALEAGRAREDAAEARDEAVRERERLETRVAELEARVQAAEAEPEPRAAPAEETGLADRAEEAEARAAEHARRVKTLEAELEAARAEVKQARTDAESNAQRAGDGTATEAPAAGGDAIRRRAGEVYEDINDVLSELRNNLILVQGEFGDLARERSDDSSRIISETLEALVGNAEDAKGVLRGLRELVEFGE